MNSKFLYLLLLGSLTFSRERLQITAQPAEKTGQSDMLLYAFPAQGWYLVSLPMRVADSSLKTVFPVSPKAFTFNFAHYEYEKVDFIKSGVGYWLAVDQPDVAVVSGTLLRNMRLHFKQGWYLIGSIADSVNFSEPDDEPDQSVLLPLFAWDDVKQEYYPTLTLQQGYGHWIAVMNECDLDLASPAAAQNRSGNRENTLRVDGRSAARTLLEQNSSNWTIPIKVVINEHQFNLVIGLYDDASASFDRQWDEIAPPPGFTPHATLWLDQFPYTLTTDLRNPQTSSTWQLAIFNAESDTCVFSWDTGDFSGKGSLTIQDSVNMLTQSSMRVNGLSKVSIRYDNTSHIDQLSSQPGQWRLHVYPNPFSTTLTIQAPPSGPQASSLIVYNLLGQKIIELAYAENSSASGIFYWDGCDALGQYVPAGLYFCVWRSPSVVITAKVLHLAMH